MTPPGPEDGEAIVQRNFGLTVEQDDWLRERSYMERRAKAEIVRDALDEYMKHHASASAA